LNYTGVYFAGHNLWPSKLVTELFLEAHESSNDVDVILHTHTPVTSFSKIHVFNNDKHDLSILDENDSPNLNGLLGRRKWTLHTPRGGVKCSYVIHATNAYAGHLLPFLSDSSGHKRYSIIPTRGQVGAVRASVDASQLGWLNSWDGGGGGWEYWFPRYQESPSKHPLIILGGARQRSGGNLEVGVTNDSELNPLVSQALREFLPDFLPGQFGAAGDDGSGGWEMEWVGGPFS